MARIPSRNLLIVNDPGPGTTWCGGRLEIDSSPVVLLGHPDDPPSASGYPEDDLVVAFSGRPRGAIPWGSETWDRFTETVEALGDANASRLVLRGHAGHVLADAPACMGWMDRQAERSASAMIALSPASMLVPAQLGNIEEHLDRMFHYLAARCRLVIIEDAVPDVCGEVMLGHRAGEGQLPGALLGAMIDSFVDPDTPVVVFARDHESARSWLWPES